MQPRQRRAKQSRRKLEGHHPAYPRRGTPAGEQLVGTCDGGGCEAVLHRGDHFVITLAGQVFCELCHGQIKPVDLEEMRRAPFVYPQEFPDAPQAAPVPAESIWDGAFPE